MELSSLPEAWLRPVRVPYESGKMLGSEVTGEITEEVLERPQRSVRAERAVWAVAILLSIGILAYGLTRAFVWDEGFHLVAAQMILAGKRPYLDFCFPQTVLNAYWNAAWMRVLGLHWWVTHIPAALEAGAALLLLTRYLLTRFPVQSWQASCTLIAILFFGANAVMVQFGPIAQAYALCALAVMASFFCMVEAVGRPSIWLAATAGFCASIGAASSLLIGPVLPVLLVWLWAKNRAGVRILKAGVFCVAATIPFGPMLWLWMQSPHVVFFNVVSYQAIFRRADWEPGLAAGHDFDVLTTWFDSGQILLLAASIVATIGFLWRDRTWPKQIREEFWLAVFLTCSLVIYISTAHPTFGRYYIVGLPIYAVAATPGFMLLGSRLAASRSPAWPTTITACLLLLGLVRMLVNERDATTWARYDAISGAIAKVTPPTAMLLSDEHVYFELNRLPPSGLEFSYSHKVDVGAKEAALLHIIPAKELARSIKAGKYATVETCDDDKIDDWGLNDLYKQRKDLFDCAIFWQLNPAAVTNDPGPIHITKKKAASAR